MTKRTKNPEVDEVPLIDLQILILAGGYSQRFEGRKAFHKINDKPIVRHVFDRVSELSDNNIIVSCKAGKENLKELIPGVEIIRDKFEEEGPVVGLLSSLPVVESQYVAVVTCDCPKIEAQVIKKLYLEGKDHDGAVPRWPNGQIEPLQAVYKTESMVKVLNAAWSLNKMKFSEILKMLSDLVYVPTEKLKQIDPELKTFYNVNSPEALQALMKKSRGE